MNHKPTNSWRLFYKANLHLLSDDLKKQSKNFLLFDKAWFSQDYFNNFCMDGSSDRVINLLIDTYKSNLDKLVIPDEIISTGPSIFYHYAEGYCSYEYFEAVHFLIRVCKLEGEIHFCNAAVNNEKLYIDHCERHNIKLKLNKFFYRNTFFVPKNKVMYQEPEFYPEELAIENKKTYICLNWSAWEHRYAAISLLNYYNLLEDGYVSSPGIDKFKKDTDQDYRKLIKNVNSFFRTDRECQQILNALVKLRSRYPIWLDDRSKFKDTDDSYDPVLRIPIHEKRLNSIFEVITETLYSGEHFFSEKTGLAFMMEKPFLMINGVESLKSLKKLGFKTFHPYIDESYDDEQDHVLRMKKVMLELKRLIELRKNDPDSFYKNVKEMKKICTHNKKTFLEGKF